MDISVDARCLLDLCVDGLKQGQRLPLRLPMPQTRPSSAIQIKSMPLFLFAVVANFWSIDSSRFITWYAKNLVKLSRIEKMVWPQGLASGMGVGGQQTE